MKVNVLGLLFAAQRLMTAAEKLRALTGPVLRPLAQDTTSDGAAGQLNAGATAAAASTNAQAASLESAALRLKWIAARFGSQEETNKADLSTLGATLAGYDEGSISALDPVPPLVPDVRQPLTPPVPDGELFSNQVNAGSSSSAGDFTVAATTAAATLQSAALTLRSVIGSIPEYWDSPVGTPALTGRLNEHVGALDAISDQWSDLGGQASRHGQQFEEAVAVTPKPQEFKDTEAAFQRASAAGDQVGMSQAKFAYGQLEARAAAEALRYAGVTEATTGVPGTAPGAGAEAGAPAAGPSGAGAGAAAAGQAARSPEQAQLAKAGAAEASQAGQAGQEAGQLAQMLPQALGAIGGMAGGMAGMAGQVPQALMQSGQGLAQAGMQGMQGLASKKGADAELAAYGDMKPDELAKAKGGGGAGGGGGGATHPAGALGPPVTPSTSHSAPTMPSGAAPPPTTPAPAGGTAMGGMPMGMPMSGMMPHGQGGGDTPDRVAADKKIVTPPQPHTEAVTGKVPDRTAAAAEASRARAESDGDDGPPPHGPVLRRITLAPLDGERT